MSMKSKPRRRYTAEFKAQAVELLETGRPVAELAAELGISTNLLYSWKQASLRREVARLRVDNDILKKAAIILGTKPQPNFAP